VQNAVLSWIECTPVDYHRSTFFAHQFETNDELANRDRRRISIKSN
jgi:hypothetical protein